MTGQPGAREAGGKPVGERLSSRVFSSRDSARKEDQESCSCGATTTAESPADAPGEFAAAAAAAAGTCAALAADRWAEALSIAIPSGVCDTAQPEGLSGKNPAKSCCSSAAAASAPNCSSQSSLEAAKPLESQPSEPDPMSMAQRVAASAAAAAENGCSTDLAAACSCEEAFQAADGQGCREAASEGRRGSTRSGNSQQSEEEPAEPPFAAAAAPEAAETEAAAAPDAQGAPEEPRASQTPGVGAPTRACAAHAAPEEAEAPGGVEAAEGAAAAHAATPRTRDKRRIKRPARYEEWVAEVSHAGEEDPSSLGSASPKQLQSRKGRKPSVRAANETPKPSKRKDRALEGAAALDPDPCGARAAATAAAASVGSRKRRLLNWLDMGAVQAAVGLGVSQPSRSSDRAVATGLAAAAAATSALAAPLTARAAAAADRAADEEAPPLDSIQAVFSRAMEILKGPPAEEQQQQQQQRPPGANLALEKREQQPVEEDRANEPRGRAQGGTNSPSACSGRQAAPAAAAAAAATAARSAAARDGPIQGPQSASAPWAALTTEFEEAAEQTAKEAAAKAAAAAAAAGRGPATEPRLTEPDVVRRFLLQHGRKPPQPAMRAPPQRADQQLQMIQEQLLEQHRQQCARGTIRSQSRARAANLQRQVHSLQGLSDDSLLRQLHLAREQLQRRQQNELQQLQEDIERHLLASAIKEEQQRADSGREPAAANLQQLQQHLQQQLQQQLRTTSAPQQQQRVHGQQDLLFEQLRQLALLENIEALLTPHRSSSEGRNRADKAEEVLPPPLSATQTKSENDQTGR
ncbi:hypothetical protein, conserved [Eimeria tenella]|uniref:Uncharacterized protein n=1 Tax=Eimeria tenella TaxID=5802 RepID=U6L1X7_EIMTE|nr:hypothetical protein, conserved [Eimeria tenella]CDJ44181.1 hypothetical protein, conserved [Eimeria tenella]|eukprot:XP_013234930.1 hypothetical protein, conserved [Eimeria tenella]